EHDHRADDRDRQGQAGDHGRAPGIEEDEDDYHGQQRALDEHVLHRMEGILHGLGIVDDDFDLDGVCGQFPRLEVGDHLADLGGDTHGVGALGLENVERYGALAIEDGKAARIAIANHDGCDITQTDSLATLVGHPHLVDI